MTGEVERSEEEGSFNKAPIWHRFIIVSAGAIVNIVFAIIVYFILTVSSGNNISTTVDYIVPEAQKNVGTLIQSGDTIKEVNGRKIRIKSDIVKAVSESNDKEIEVVLLRNNEEKRIKVVLTEYSEGYYILGIVVRQADKNIKDRLYYSFWETIDFSGSVFESLGMLVTGKIGVKQMTGPIGISDIASKTSGIYDFISLLALISLSLGVTNLLPVPALDGGRLVLILLEGIRGKALKEEIELGIQSIGFALLILFSLYVSYNDILRIF